MTQTISHEIHLASRPHGIPTAANFTLWHGIGKISNTP